MKRLAMIIVLSTGLVAGPAMADHEGRNLLNRENIGGAIGAALGGLAGNKIVEGDGQSAATAAGAVGGFLIGKNIAHNYGGRRYTGPRYSTGHYRAGGYRRDVGYDRAGDYRRSAGYDRGRDYDRHKSRKHRTCCDGDDGYRYGIRPIHATYVATCASNVRAGPSTRYHVIDQLYERERVRVTGKVKGRNWYQVKVGHRRGYVYAPLLRPTRYGYGGHKDRHSWRR